jgi:energy-coupling factor transport system permease protein
MPFHPFAWLLWWLTALVAALLTRNPLYLVLLILVMTWVRITMERAASNHPPPANLATLRLGLFIVTLGACFNGLTVHIGATVLARLPGWLPLFGGPITLEAIVFGFISGLGLVTLITVFAAFNTAADYQALLRLVPSFLFQAGLVTSIALAFVPQTLQALDEIREAQMIRGHRFRGWRDLPPLFLPLLTSGLERSIQLAEAMESRGFGAPASPAHLPAPPPPSAAQTRIWPQFATPAALLLTIAGSATFLLLGQRPLGLVLTLAGVALLLMSLHLGGNARRGPRSRYRPQPWQRPDIVLTTASLVLLLWLVALNTQAASTLLYYPYPRVRWPSFDPLIGGLLLVLALPVFLLPTRRPSPQEKP